MGFYINPKQDKETWCKDNAVKSKPFATPNDMSTANKNGNCFVCYIDNFAFDCILILINENERQMAMQDDGRFKLFFEIPKKIVLAEEPSVLGHGVFNEEENA